MPKNILNRTILAKLSIYNEFMFVNVIILCKFIMLALYTSVK